MNRFAYFYTSLHWIIVYSRREHKEGFPQREIEVQKLTIGLYLKKGFYTKFYLFLGIKSLIAPKYF